MIVRALAVLILAATVVSDADVARILCFGADGHVAFESLGTSEHWPVERTGGDDALRTAQSAGTHIDVAVPEIGVRSAPVAPDAHVAALDRQEPLAPRQPQRFAVRRGQSSSDSLVAPRSTVLRI